MDLLRFKFESIINLDKYQFDNLPIALGVVRDVEAPTYDNEQEKQMKEVQKL